MIWLIDFKEESWKEQDSKEEIVLESFDLDSSIDIYDKMWYNYSEEEGTFYAEKVEEPKN